MIYGWPGAPLQTGSNDCLKATAPFVSQELNDIAIGDGATPATLVDLGTNPAVQYGLVTPVGCHNLLLTVTYLTGSDCDSCTVDTLTESTVTIFIRKNTPFTLPQGHIVQVDYVVVDETQAPIATTTEQSVEFYGVGYNGACCPALSRGWVKAKAAAK